jgi:hypothetical protein
MVVCIACVNTQVRETLPCCLSKLIPVSSWTSCLLSVTNRSVVNRTAYVSIRCRYEEGEQLLVLIRDKVLPGGKGPYRESAQDNVRVKVTLSAFKYLPCYRATCC